ncbi:hypothetical protein ACJMK2_024556 [Sinanodonta woodiana]|uniref:Uncharacterized protein n=1 Tax=Sinanodonta woodiana TaxID=1069815 RepID=A0ABD3XDR6_SINWO
MAPVTRYRLMMSFFIELAIIVTVGGQDSQANALNLMNLWTNIAAFMNMNAKCGQTQWTSTCPSNCRVQDSNGCYVCSPDCKAVAGTMMGTGSGEGIAPVQSPMQPISDQNLQGTHMCPGVQNIMSCPFMCLKQDSNGCFICTCEVVLTGNPNELPNNLQTIKPTTAMYEVSSHLMRNKSLDSFTLSAKSSQIPSKTTTSQSVHTKTQSRTVSYETNRGNGLAQSTTAPLNSILAEPVATTKMSVYDSQNYVINQNNTGMLVENKYTAFSSGKKKNTAMSTFNGGDSRTSDNSSNVVSTTVLGSLLFVGMLTSLVLLFLWRRTKYQLKREKNELYFVEKTMRQDSRAPIERNDFSEPVYADPGKGNMPTSIPPEVPPRTPPVTPLSPTAPFFKDGVITISDLVPYKQITFPKETVEFRNEYLELI